VPIVVGVGVGVVGMVVVVVLAGVLAALNATACSTHPVPVCAAATLCGPVSVATRSKTRLPKAVERVVNRGPAAMIVLVDAPAANNRSRDRVVVRLAVLMAEPVPAFAVAASIPATPLYSLMYPRPNLVTGVVNVSVTT
jgi:hypothetical protein